MQEQAAMYNQQLNFAKYLEIHKYNFRGTPLNNPLLPLYSINKSDIAIPFTHLSFDNNNAICTSLIAEHFNVLDRKPVNCIKMFGNSNKLLYGTTTGKLIVCDIYNSFRLSCNNQLSHNSSIRAMQFNKPETYFLIGDASGKLHYFTSTYTSALSNIISNTAGNYDIKHKNSLQKHSDTITDISFSINDTKYVTSSDDKTSKITDFNTGIVEVDFKEHLSDVKSCDWNPYKNVIASGGKDKLVKLWDPSSKNNVIDTLHPHKNSINRVRFNKNGNWLLTASKDHLLKVIDIRMMKELQTFKGHNSEVNTMVWHPLYEDVFCSAGADRFIIFWKVGVNKCYKKLAHMKEIFDLCSNKTGTLLASGSNDAYLKFWIRGKE